MRTSLFKWGPVGLGLMRDYNIIVGQGGIGSERYNSIGRR